MGKAPKQTLTRIQFQLFLLRIDPKQTHPKFLENALGPISSRPDTKRNELQWEVLTRVQNVNVLWVDFQ